jgi:drug/metabolite transporter (DMT)-like permease
MNKLAGIICLVAGVLLVVTGYNAAHELGAKVHHVVTGAIPDRARFLLLTGAVLGLLGVFQIYTAKR